VDRIQEYIFNHSPKKIAIYLVLGPMVLFFVHTIITIIFRNISSAYEHMVSVIWGLLSLFLAVFIALWLFWLRSTVYSVEETQLGLARKWFQIAFIFLWFFIFFNTLDSVRELFVEKDHWNDEYRYLFNASREFINFGGIMVAYPIVCHYAARATMVKRHSKSAPFVNTIPFTLLLIFGTVLGIPFMHNYFTEKTSKNAEVIIVYAIAFGVFITTLIMGFIAAITGWV